MGSTVRVALSCAGGINTSDDPADEPRKTRKGPRSDLADVRAGAEDSPGPGPRSVGFRVFHGSRTIRTQAVRPSGGRPECRTQFPIDPTAEQNQPTQAISETRISGPDPGRATGS
jgi:hypothetical protein